MSQGLYEISVLTTGEVLAYVAAESPMDAEQGYTLPEGITADDIRVVCVGTAEEDR